MLDWIRRRFSKESEPEVDRGAALATRPVRNRAIKWEQGEEGEEPVKLQVPLRGPTGKRSRLLPMPESKTIELDAIGSDLWRRADGEHTTEDLIAWMHDRYQFAWKEAEMGVTNYLRELARRRLVILVGPDAGRS